MHRQSVDPLHGRVHRRLDDRPGQPAGHADPDRAGPGLAGPGAGRGQPGRLDHARTPGRSSRWTRRRSRRWGWPARRASPAARPRPSTTPPTRSAWRRSWPAGIRFAGIVDTVAQVVSEHDGCGRAAVTRSERRARGRQLGAGAEQRQLAGHRSNGARRGRRGGRDDRDELPARRCHLRGRRAHLGDAARGRALPDRQEVRHEGHPVLRRASARRCGRRSAARPSTAIKALPFGAFVQDHRHDHARRGRPGRRAPLVPQQAAAGSGRSCWWPARSCTSRSRSCCCSSSRSGSALANSSTTTIGSVASCVPASAKALAQGSCKNSQGSAPAKTAGIKASDKIIAIARQAGPATGPGSARPSAPSPRASRSLSPCCATARCCT